MKILIVNNRLKVYGGEGTYFTSVGDELIKRGHDVQFFGVNEEGANHGNRYNLYAKKSKNPLSILNNKHNVKMFGKLLDQFKPDLIHINLVYFTLTPSILVEAKKRNIPVVQTVHDGKIVCPSYQLFNQQRNIACTICKDGKFKNCVSNKCMKNSFFLSYLAYKEATYNKKRNLYGLIDRFIFPSEFMRRLHMDFGISQEKTCVLQSFTRINKRKEISPQKKKYIIFFGRLINIKGANILLEVAKKLKDIEFVIAGEGEYKEGFQRLPNCKAVGFQEKDRLTELVENAYLSVFPSICLENCPMGIAESTALCTPVIGANVGGIPELIAENKTGVLFKSGDAADLERVILETYKNEDFVYKMTKNCLESATLDDVVSYCDKLLEEYKKVL